MQQGRLGWMTLSRFSANTNDFTILSKITAMRIAKRWRINRGRDAVATSAGTLDIMSLSFVGRSETDDVVFTTCGCSIDAYDVNWGWQLNPNRRRLVSDLAPSIWFRGSS